MAMCPSMTPGFSPMPPTVIQRAWEARGIPHPAPFPNIPTVVRPTVPRYFFHIWGDLSAIRTITRKAGSNSSQCQWRAFEPSPCFCHVLHLGCRDLVMNLANGLAVGGSDDVGHDLRISSHVTLNRGIHIHLIKHDEVFPAFAIGLHGFVLIDGFCQAGSEERRERQGLPSGRFMLSEARARPGHIDFEQAMDHGLVLDGPIRERLQAPHLWIRDHLVSSVLLFHALSPSLRWNKTFRL